MKSRQYLGKDFKLCILKYLVVCSLSSLVIQAVSSASIPDCEIRASCSQSRGCRYTNQRTVSLGFKVTSNCSIMNGGVARGMTWNQVKQRVNANDGLVLQQMNSNTGINSCRCIRIQFTRAVRKVFKTSSPVWVMYPDKEIYLKFAVKGWPRPRVVWYKQGKQIINGSEGFYLSEKLVGEDTLRSILHHPKGGEKHEGIYKCVAENSISGWSSKITDLIELIYECPWPEHPTVNSSEVSAKAFSNISLKCLVEVDPDNCFPNFSLQWHFNNNSTPLKAGEKYEIQERKTNTRCKKDFVLTIVNVTDTDEGKYSCHFICELENKSADIELNVFPKLTDLTTLLPTTTNSSQTAAHIRRQWILPIIILSSGVVFILIITAVSGIKTKKCASSDSSAKHDITNNMLFISYSSNDFAWVNENLISLLEKHSISYGIHTRDFELGKPFVQNMADSVYGSRQVLIVLSDNYLASHFCREELHMAVQRGVDTGDSSLILVLINKLKKKRLPGALRSKHLVDFEKHKMKQDWEKKLLHAILDGKAAKANPVIV